VIEVPRHANTAITVVQVLDPDGTAHDVTLQPTLNSSSC
jgi:hypothetical protein